MSRTKPATKANEDLKMHGVVNGVTYFTDCDSGWENDEDVVWIIDEGNAADWETAQPWTFE